MKRVIYILVAALAAASCVYKFEPEGIVSQSRVVIEGDIIVGGTTHVHVSCSEPIIYDPEFYGVDPRGEAWVEGEDGSIFNDKTQTAYGKSQFTIDTQKARPGVRYRLHFKETGTSKEYVSEWQDVVPAPEITGMSFDYDSEKVFIRVSADGKDTKYFRWDYVEDWEVHAEYAPMFKFNTETWQCEQLLEPDYSTYWCWNHYESREFGLVSTESQSENRLEGQIIESYARKSSRFQYLYRMDLTLTGMNSDAYAYLRNMKEISNISGSLFAPSPDDMRGNIICEQDPSEFVVGFISAVQPAKKRFYITSDENAFYRAPAPTILVEPVLENDTTIYDYYMAGHRPVFEEMVEMAAVVKWGPRSCVDCTVMGGNKNKPADWPNDHN